MRQVAMHWIAAEDLFYLNSINQKQFPGRAGK